MLHKQGKEEFERQQKELLEKENIIKQSKTELEHHQVRSLRCSTHTALVKESGRGPSLTCLFNISLNATERRSWKIEGSHLALVNPFNMLLPYRVAENRTGNAEGRFGGLSSQNPTEMAAF